MKITAKKLQEFKAKGKKITSITAYDYSTAKFCDKAGFDFILVGDSLAHVILGYDSTTKIGMDEMKIFTAAVARGCKECLIVSDMPFLSYQANLSDAVKNAGELIKCGAAVVKLEGATPYIVNLVEHLTSSGIPVMGHLGFTPQYVGTIGGHFVMGKDFDTTISILEQAKALERAGACAVVLEMVPYESAEFISRNLTIPTIGIGAGAGCDGQIIVSEDILGRYEDFCPKFARKYVNLGETITEVFKNYIKDVVEMNFPSKEESFYLKPEEKEKLESYKNGCRL
jgi:3-methyl-2-oxobutanoate hydroxymethyltransferase